MQKEGNKKGARGTKAINKNFRRLGAITTHKISINLNKKILLIMDQTKKVFSTWNAA
jgi:hypothetical protein